MIVYENWLVGRSLIKELEDAYRIRDEVKLESKIDKRNKHKIYATSAISYGFVSKGSVIEMMKSIEFSVIITESFLLDLIEHFKVPSEF